MADENFDTFVTSRGAAGVLAGTEPIPCVSGGNTKQTTPAAIKTYVAADPAGSAAAAQAAAEAASDPVGSAAAAQAAAIAASDPVGSAATLRLSLLGTWVYRNDNAAGHLYFDSSGALLFNSVTADGVDAKNVLERIPVGSLVSLYQPGSFSFWQAVVNTMNYSSGSFQIQPDVLHPGPGSFITDDALYLRFDSPGVAIRIAAAQAAAIAASDPVGSAAAAQAAAIAASDPVGSAAAAQAAAIAASDPAGSAAAAQAAAIAASDPAGSAAAAQAAAIAASDPAGSAAAAQAAAIAASDPVGSAAAAQSAANAHTDGFFLGAFSGTGAFTNFTFLNGVCTAAS